MVFFLDWLETYSTSSTVEIRHTCLGISCKLFYLFAVIVVFVLLSAFQMLYGTEIPQGVVHLTLYPPEHWSNIKNISYCSNSDNPGTDAIYPCKFFDPAILVFPQAMDSTVSLATCITNCTQVPIGGLDSDKVKWVNVTENNTFFLADVENYLIEIDHSFIFNHYKLQVPSWRGKRERSKDIEGKLVDYNGTEIKVNSSLGERVGKKRLNDKILVSTLIKAAENGTLDYTPEDSNGTSLRINGAVYEVELNYRNTDNIVGYIYERDVLKYEIKVRKAANEYSATQAIYSNQLDRREIIDRHSIHFVFIPSGELMYTDMFRILTACSWLVTISSLTKFIFDCLIGTKAFECITDRCGMEGVREEISTEKSYSSLDGSDSCCHCQSDCCDCNNGGRRRNKESEDMDGFLQGLNDRDYY